ncbi:MAG: hypothetical protein ACRC80_15060 [Waterburya sp.]
MSLPIPHWLRHFHASHSQDRGAPPQLVQQTLDLFMEQKCHQARSTTRYPVRAIIIFTLN